MPSIPFCASSQLPALLPSDPPLAQSEAPGVQLLLSCSTRVLGRAMPAPGPCCTPLFSTPLYLSCSAPTAVCGDGAFRMRFLRKCLSVVGAGTSQRPAVARGCCSQLCVRRAPPGNAPRCRPACAPCHSPRVSQMLALSLLVLSLLMTHISSHLDLSRG